MYEYNDLRRLIKATENNAITQMKPVRAETVVSDYDGQRMLALAAKDTEIALDAGGASLGKSFPGTVELLGCVVVPLLKTHRVDDDHLVVYLRDGSSWKRCASEEYVVNLSADSGAIEISFKTKRTASGIKVHCLWDERNLDYTVNESHTNFKNRSDRILTLHYIDTNRVITYTYDAEGNRTAETLSDSVAGNTTKTYTYWANTNWLKTDGTNAYVYDKLGNLIEKGTNYTITANSVSWSATSGIYWKYDYDIWGHLIRVQKGDKGTNNAATIMSASYDAGGILRTKTKGSRTWRYWYGTDGNMVHQTMKDSANASLSWEKGFVYIAGKLAGYSETRSDVTKRYWVQTDQLGTVVRETDEAGKVVAAQEYATFGTDPGSVATGTHEMLQWYTGKEWDADVGLYYFNARWYDPDIGRFITEDPVRDDSNWYVYCLNSPETWVDPSGKTVWSMISYYTMNQPNAYWTSVSRQEIGGTIGDFGCAIAAMANGIATLTGKDVDPGKINSRDDNFAEKGLIWDNPTVHEYGLTGFREEGKLTQEKFDALNNNENIDVVVFVYAMADKEGEYTHWIGIEGLFSIDNITYFAIAKSSENDLPTKADRQKNGWIELKDATLGVPVDKTDGFAGLKTNEKHDFSSKGTKKPAVKKTYTKDDIKSDTKTAPGGDSSPQAPTSPDPGSAPVGPGTGDNDSSDSNNATDDSGGEK